MSRVWYGEVGDFDYGSLDQGRWERNSVAVLASKRGQGVLVELEASLLALPRKRLISETFYESVLIPSGLGDDEDEPTYVETFDVCVLGAYALAKWDIDTVVRHGGDEFDVYEMAETVSHTSRMTYTMAWNLMEKNDEHWALYTPEARYAAMLQWVRDHIDGNALKGADATPPATDSKLRPGQQPRRQKEQP